MPSETPQSGAGGPDYSVVVPVYYNEESVEATAEDLVKEVVLQNAGYAAEILFVDDGSGDGSLQKLLAIRKKYPEIVRVIKLTRNFGQVNAILAGLDHSRGKCVVVLSADGQDPPSLINDMLWAHFEDECEIVLCARVGRDESFFRRLTSKLFYALMRKLSFKSMPLGGFDYFLLGAKALDTLRRNYEAHGFLQGQILWTGYRTKFLTYQRRRRSVGKSRWTFGKKLTYLIDGVMSYSFVPIRLISIVGGLVALVGFIYAVLLVGLWLAKGHPVQGWTAMMVLVLVLSGVQLLMLGVIGEYLWRTLAQARNRDAYVIERTYD